MKELKHYSGDEGYYEWDEIGIYQREDGALAVDQQGGCSCNSYEEPREDQLTWRHDVIPFYRAVVEALGSTCFFTAAQKAEISLDVRKIWKETHA